MADYRKLTILHSNDMHGDFLAETIDDSLVGGVSMLSGYLNKERNQDPEALYVIAGDMFRGSIIDAEYQGVSTIEIMNYLAGTFHIPILKLLYQLLLKFHRIVLESYFYFFLMQR